MSTGGFESDFNHPEEVFCVEPTFLKLKNLGLVVGEPRFEKNVQPKEKTRVFFNIPRWALIVIKNFHGSKQAEEVYEILGQGKESPDVQAQLVGESLEKMKNDQ